MQSVIRNNQFIENNTSFSGIIDLVKKEKMMIDDFISLPPCLWQRFTEARGKTKKVKASLSKLRPEHLEVAIAELTKECEYYGIIYPKGTRWILNGNTRKHFWENRLSDMIPSFVYATVYSFDSMEDMKISYNTFDSLDAVEQRKEKLYGILHRVHNFTPKCSKLSTGEILTALNFASSIYDPKMFNHATIKTEQIDSMVTIFIEEIKAFDEICKNPKMWDQALIGGALVSLKVYGTKNKKLLECLNRIDRRMMNTFEKARDGATHICQEWDTKTRWPQKGTAFQLLTETTAFVIYWIKKFMEDEMLTMLGNNWKDAPSAMMEEYRKSKAVNMTLNQFFDVNQMNNAEEHVSVS